MQSFANRFGFATAKASIGQKNRGGKGDRSPLKERSGLTARGLHPCVPFTCASLMIH